MSNWKYRFKLSKGSLLLLHLAAVGHVWRDSRREWVASTERNKRNVDMRVQKMIHLGVLSATYSDNFLEITELGRQYMQDYPLDDVLQVMIR